jgi:hypothetical protein
MEVSGVLWFDIFFNKGLVLNLKGFKGKIILSNCDFFENMYNIPGLAY